MELEEMVLGRLLQGQNEAHQARMNKFPRMGWGCKPVREEMAMQTLSGTQDPEAMSVHRAL